MTGMTIHYAVAPTYLGWVLVVASDRGVCAIEFADDPGLLVEALHARFPQAVLDDSDHAVHTWLRAVLAYLDSPQGQLDLPLDVQGTAFQQQVWQMLRDVPAGRTITHGELAARLGNARASRAVGSACAANPVAIAIPCHRAVRQSGELGGYRWGLARKQALLAREAKIRPA